MTSRSRTAMADSRRAGEMRPSSVATRGSAALYQHDETRAAPAEQLVTGRQVLGDVLSEDGEHLVAGLQAEAYVDRFEALQREDRSVVFHTAAPYFSERGSSEARVGESGNSVDLIAGRKRGMKRVCHGFGAKILHTGGEGGTGGCHALDVGGAGEIPLDFLDADRHFGGGARHFDGCFRKHSDDCLELILPGGEVPDRAFVVLFQEPDRGGGYEKGAGFIGGPFKLGPQFPHGVFESGERGGVVVKPVHADALEQHRNDPVERLGLFFDRGDVFGCAFCIEAFQKWR
jgi:hypothetical protein